MNQRTGTRPTRCLARTLALILPVLLLFVGAPSEIRAQDQTHVLIVSGLGGEAQFRQDFLEWGDRMVDAALQAGIPPERITWLAEDPDMSPERIQARSTREEVERTIERLAEGSDPSDRILILLIGHGSGSGADSRVSLPGPSLTAGEYDQLLESLTPRTVALVNAASGSGDYAEVLAGEGRVVITATRSSQQRNAVVFGGYFVEAFAELTADLDRDGRVSLLEAFEFARQETERHYRDRNLVASEQALLEDRPVGGGVAQPGDDPDVGERAARFYLGSASLAGPVATDPETAARIDALLAAQDSLEADLRELDARPDSGDATERRVARQNLLVELARVGQELRALEVDP